MRRTEPETDSLDERISEARNRLQRIPEWHPEFERRLAALIRLMDARDERMDIGSPRARTAGGWR